MDENNYLRRIFWGVGGAVFAAYVAYGCFASGETIWIRGGRLPDPTGWRAIIQGIQFTCIATSLHLHGFWEAPEKRSRFWRVLTRVSDYGFVICTIFVLKWSLSSLPRTSG